MPKTIVNEKEYHIGPRADLRHADLRGATLSHADLSHADLSCADLSYADLSRADLFGADLRGASLAYADLRGADLRGADLRYADLRGAVGVTELVAARLSILPDEGEVIGWKKCRYGVIVKLRIPSDAKRSNATDRKCRAERAEVLEVIGAKIGVSKYCSGFTYRQGQIIIPEEPFNEDRFNECASGIHFYITRAEAEAH